MPIEILIDLKLFTFAKKSIRVLDYEQHTIVIDTSRHTTLQWRHVKRCSHSVHCPLTVACVVPQRFHDQRQ
jgi:hypothetical protein